jgi:thioredoxin 1
MTTAIYTDRLTTTDVDEIVAAADRPLLLNFGADWCPPCHALAPVLAEIAAEHPDTITVRKVNVDDVPDLVIRWGIASAPTMLLFVDGELEAKIVGARPKAALVEMLSPYL